MAGGPTGKAPSTETHRSTVDAREELKRTLDRDTAVQGEREEEAVAATRTPAGAESAPPRARPGTATPHGRKR